MRIIFMGTPAFVTPVLEALLASEHQVVGVYTQPDRPKGRGRTEEPSPLKRLALQRQLKVVQPPSLRHSAVQQALASLRPELVVVAGYGRIVPPEVLRIPAHGCLNLHPSLLPRYRGPSPVVSALLAGDDVTGVTLMLMDEGLDSGPILAQQSVSIERDETADHLTHRLFQRGAQLLMEHLAHWVEGRIALQPQDPAEATFTRKIVKDQGEAQWDLAAEELERRRRAFTPWPGLFTRWRGGVLKILQSMALSMDSPGGPGLVVPLAGDGGGAGVVTGRGVLGLKLLQLEGRRPAPIGDFLRGHPDFLGSRLPS